ncbi:MAG: hypothetical protein IPP35_09475 [Elusimicrobia bacterium]|nr:hypothetical protein [Elusimicrobiota bacterium]
MTYKRLTITFPEDLVTRVQRCIHGRGFSTYLAEAAREKLKRDDKATLAKRLAEGYAQSGGEDRAIAQDWNTVTADGL